MHTKHRFPIGTKYTTRHKHPRHCTVIDRLTVTNDKGEIVETYYTAMHQFLGQIVLDTRVGDTTIAMGNPILPDATT